MADFGLVVYGLAQEVFVNLKHLRKRAHTHHPVDDARDNADVVLAMKETVAVKISCK